LRSNSFALLLYFADVAGEFGRAFTCDELNALLSNLAGALQDIEAAWALLSRSSQLSHERMSKKPAGSPPAGFSLRCEFDAQRRQSRLQDHGACANIWADGYA
jgi:hypothetical protein